MDEERIVEIETKIAFQENTIKVLNDVVCKQQEEIEQLQRNCKLLFNQMKELSAQSSGDNLKHERPPHY